MEPEQDKKKLPYIKVLIYSTSISFVVFGIILFVIPYTVNNWVINGVGNNTSSLAGSWISFWGSFLGGIVGMFAVLLTTNFLIKNQNKHHKKQIELQQDQHQQIIDQQIKAIKKQDENERKRYQDQLIINQGEDTILKLSEVADRLIEYNRLVNSFKYILEDLGRISYDIQNTDSDNDRRELMQVEQNVYNSYFENLYKLAEIEIKITKLLTILKTRSRIYSNANFDDIYNSFKNYVTKVNGLFRFSIHELTKIEILSKQDLNFKMNDYASDINGITIKINNSIKQLLFHIENELNNIEEMCICEESCKKEEYVG